MDKPGEEIIARFLLGKCTEEELIRINIWIKESDENACKLFRMEETFHLGRESGISDEKKLEQAEKRLYRKLNTEVIKRYNSLKIHTWIKYAAVITIFLLVGTGVGYWVHDGMGNNMIVAMASGGNVEKIILPDGTKVWLNQSTTLKYPHEFSRTERNVYLDGEAYFEVTKNPIKPFIVQSKSLRVKVLGTTFNLRCNKSRKSAEATLIEGEIEVKGNNEEGMIILSPGQKAELDKVSGRLTVKQVDAKLDAVWHNNLIPFEQADIYTIIQTLERFYNVKIIIAPDTEINSTYSGILKKKENIESVLNSLKNSIPIDYKIVGSSIFISSRK